MPISPTAESQNTAITATNESKTGSTITWDEAYDTWDESTGTWDNPGIMSNNDTQNSISPSNEAQN